MKNVFELGYRYVFPAIRRRLVEILHNEYEVEQQFIAEKLGLTQSAVSRYLLGERGRTIDLRNYSDVNKKVRELAKRIIEENIDMYDIYRELTRITLYVLSRRYLCKYHAEIDPDVDPSRCNLCPELFKDYK